MRYDYIIIQTQKHFIVEKQFFSLLCFVNIIVQFIVFSAICSYLENYLVSVATQLFFQRLMWQKQK